MTFTDFHKRGLELANKFKGRAKEYFAALKLEFPDSNLPEMIEREHKRNKGTASSETLKPIFAALKPAATAIEQIGRSVVQLATSPNPKISGPITKGIEKSLAAHQKITAAEFISENAAPTMTLEEFRKLPHALRSKFCLSGGRIVPDAEEPVAPLDPNAKVATLKQFNTLPHALRSEWLRCGGKLIEEPAK